MKLLSKFGFSDFEQKIVIITIAASFVLMIVFVAAHLFLQPKSDKPVKTIAELIPQALSIQSVTAQDIDANKIVGVRYFESNDYESAIPYLQRVVALRSTDTYARSILADALLEWGEYEKAMTEYDYLLAQELPDSLAGRTCARRAICQFYNKEQNESLNALKQCAEQYPNTPEAFCFLGQIEAMQEMPSNAALENLNKAIALDSNYVEAWYQLARYYMDLKEYARAREYLLRAIDINPLHGKSQSRLGMVYFYLNNFDLAKKAYQTALALNPLDFNTRYNLGEVYYSENDSVKAIREFKKTLEYNPGHVEANFKLGLLLLANGMTKEAIIHLEQAAHNDKNNSRILIQLAVAYEKLGDKNKAFSIYQSILEFDALNPVAQQKVKLLLR